jgi:translation initiation factor IF-3
LRRLSVGRGRRGLDLVEVAPQANPVVCKIIDFGKYLYAREKRGEEETAAAATEGDPPEHADR